MSAFTHKETSLLVSLLIKRPELIAKKPGQTHANGKNLRKIWEEITAELNAACLSSYPKDTKDVIKKWSDLKYRTKKKYLRIQNCGKPIDGICKRSVTLNSVEEQVLQLVGAITVVNGCDEEISDEAEEIEDLNSDLDWEELNSTDGNQELVDTGGSNLEPVNTAGNNPEPEDTGGSNQEPVKSRGSTQSQDSDQEMEDNYISNHLRILQHNLSKVPAQSTARVKRHRERKKVEEDRIVHEILLLKKKSVKIKEEILKEEKRRNDLLEKILQKL